VLTSDFDQIQSQKDIDLIEAQKWPWLAGADGFARSNTQSCVDIHGDREESAEEQVAWQKQDDRPERSPW
jgi:hypothetical protein